MFSARTASPPHRSRVVATVLGAALATLLSLGAWPQAASAATDPVPEDVERYLEGGLLTRLIDLYAPGLEPGSGIDFSEGTVVGEPSRLREWTEAFLRGDSDGPAVQLTNEWVTPIAIDGEPVGVALVWINPGSNQPELADFAHDPGLVDVLATVPEGAIVVAEPAVGAWFALHDEQVIPLRAGASGVDGPSSLEAAQSSIVAAELEAATEAGSSPSDTGGLVAGVAVILLVVVAGLLVFVFRPRERGAEVTDLQPSDEIA